MSTGGGQRRRRRTYMDMTDRIKGGGGLGGTEKSCRGLFFSVKPAALLLSELNQDPYGGESDFQMNALKRMFISRDHNPQYNWTTEYTTTTFVLTQARSVPTSSAERLQPIRSAVVTLSRHQEVPTHVWGVISSFLLKIATHNTAATTSRPSHSRSRRHTGCGVSLRDTSTLR